MTQAPLLAGRSAIVTGAGKSIGRAIALALASHGARVLVNNRKHTGESTGSAAAVVSEIEAAGGVAVANTDSVEQAGAAAAMVEQALASFGSLDIVIANAGVAPEKRIAGMTESSLREAFEINYFAPVALTQAALPALRTSGSGRLIYIISNAGLYGGDGLAAYGSTKAALYAFMRSAATEGRRSGITANALAPFALSQMTAARMTDELRAALPAHWIGPVASWLASAACSTSGKVYVTGGGLISEARVGETAPVQFTTTGTQAITDVRQCLDDLAAAEACINFDGAMDAFQHTIGNHLSRGD